MKRYIDPIFSLDGVSKHFPLTLVDSFCREESGLKYDSELSYAIYAQNTFNTNKSSKHADVLIGQF